MVRAAEAQLLLAGGGHSHALVLQRWAMARRRPGTRPAARITLVSRHSTALYSGMVPGLLAGIYDAATCTIDLRRLCQLADVSFVQAEITGLDPQDQTLQLLSRPSLRWDWLSLDVGAETEAVAGAALGIKPLEPALAWCSQPRSGPLRIRGGGAAAVEVALALQARGQAAELLLRGAELSLQSAAANRLGERMLRGAGIPIQRHTAEGLAADLACTGSRGAPWLAAAGLACDKSGRVLTDSSLQVQGHPRLFASGDCGVIAGQPRPASGVWAVRSAPTLARNLARALAGEPLRPWRPQRLALQLLGDGGSLERNAAGQAVPQAVAFWGPWAVGPHRLLWHWKAWLDRRFMARFSNLKAMQPGEASAMACRGCAAKLGASPLQQALSRCGLGGGSSGDRCSQAEDAAVIARSTGGGLLLQSVDGFPALLDDPWLNGRLTTLHACSDLWASGAAVETVQALVTLPELAPQLQADLLGETLAGIQSVLEPLGAKLVGGHSLEARDSQWSPQGRGLSVLLSVNGQAAAGRHWGKGPLQDGDRLLLCRPIGTGVLFAAAMAGAARPPWIDNALRTMQQSQAELVDLLARHGCHACTDVTGFGLLGHLGEMLAASPAGCRVRLDAAAIPALPGALTLLEQGWQSSLAPSNAGALALIGERIQLAEPIESARLGLLVDPQTCGPLLAAIPGEEIGITLTTLQRYGFVQATAIGRVQA